MSRSSTSRFFFLNLVVAILMVAICAVSYHNDPIPWRHESPMGRGFILELFGMTSLGISVVLWPVVRKDEPEFPRTLPPEHPTRAPAYARLKR